VERHQAVGPGRREAHRRARPGDVEPFEVAEQGVDHRVADEVDALGRDALAREVADRLGAGDQVQRRQRVGEPAVDLLGHRVVEAAQAGLDMRDRHVQLRGDQCRGQGRVDVAVHDEQSRVELDELVLQRGEQRGRLAGMAAGAHTQVDVGPWQAELAEEDVGHPLVVVLAGVDEHVGVIGPSLRRPHHGRRLHEVGPGPHDMHDGPSPRAHGTTAL
jgi:hypothetical protein